MEFKIGDIVIGIKNDPQFTRIDIIGKIGKIVEIITHIYPYGIQWNETICSKSNAIRFQSFNYFRDKDIRPITKLKLNKLLKGD